MGLNTTYVSDRDGDSQGDCPGTLVLRKGVSQKPVEVPNLLEAVNFNRQFVDGVKRVARIYI